VSPDGRSLAFTLAKDRKLSIWIRPIASETPVRLENTDRGAMPFWSPDSKQIGYFASTDPTQGVQTWQIKRIPAGGGLPEVVCASKGNADGASWNRDGVILFASGNSPLYRVPATGGEPKPVTALDTARGETSHSMPEFLSDGRHFIFWSNNRDPEKRAIWVGALDSTERTMVMLNETMPGFAAPDHLLFSRDGTLYAQQLDLKQFRLLGKPTAVGENVHELRKAFSASSNGVLVYRETGPSGRPGAELTWYSRQGARLRNVGERMPYREVRLSPDERYAALDAWATNGTRLYLLDMQTQVTSLIPPGKRLDDDPVWSPDSHRLVFANHGMISTPGPATLMEWRLGDLASRPILEETDTWITPEDWSPDGRFLVVRRNNRSLGTVPVEGGGQARNLFEVDPKSLLDEAHLSPDGRYLAYHTTETGDFQVYVVSFPSITGKKQVSTGGGCMPFWRKDGKELFYISSKGEMMSVQVKPGAVFDASAPNPLFQAPPVICGFDRYAVAADGQSFLMIEPSPQNRMAQPVHAILHWDAGLRR
jgi:Tol biopolymer transport system component